MESLWENEVLYKHSDLNCLHLLQKSRSHISVTQVLTITINSQGILDALGDGSHIQYSRPKIFKYPSQ